MRRNRPHLFHFSVLPDQDAVVSVRDERDRLLTTPGSLGVLDRAVDRSAALRHPHSDRAVLVIAASDHPVTRHGVSAYSASVTREVLRRALLVNQLDPLAKAAGLDVVLVDAGIEKVDYESAEGALLWSSAISAAPLGFRGELVEAADS